MPDIVAIDAMSCRFPEHARRIRALRAEDATFRAICEDYAEAVRALAHWQGVGECAQERIEEYRQIVTELEEEALEAMSAYAG